MCDRAALTLTISFDRLPGPPVPESLMGALPHRRAKGGGAVLPNTANRPNYPLGGPRGIARGCCAPLGPLAGGRSRQPLPACIASPWSCVAPAVPVRSPSSSVRPPVRALARGRQAHPEPRPRRLSVLPQLADTAVSSPSCPQHLIWQRNVRACGDRRRPHGTRLLPSDVFPVADVDLSSPMRVAARRDGVVVRILVSD